MRLSWPPAENRLSSATGSSHFHAKSINWSMRTRGSVARIHTKVNTKTYVLSMNQRIPATQSSPMYSPLAVFAEAIVAALDGAFARYAAERAAGERFGDFAWRAGLVGVSAA